jgi:hypothetical protein
LKTAGSAARAGQAIGTGSRVRIAGVDEHRADAGAGRGQVLAADLHWRRAKPILREHAGDRGARFQQHHCQVLAIGLAYTGFRDAQPHARNRMKVGWMGSGEVDGHE